VVLLTLPEVILYVKKLNRELLLSLYSILID